MFSVIPEHSTCDNFTMIRLEILAIFKNIHIETIIWVSPLSSSMGPIQQQTFSMLSCPWTVQGKFGPFLEFYTEFHSQPWLGFLVISWPVNDV